MLKSPIAAWLLLCAFVAGDEPARRNTPSWLDEPQTYCMVPVLPEMAARLHVSVNGVWAGIAGTHPILTHREIVPAVQAKYAADPAAFVDDSHQAGLIVCSIVNGLEGFPAMRGEWPALDDMACRNAQGEPARVGDGMTLMCTNNPDWLQWEIDYGKRGIEAGADCVLVDTPMSSSFISGFLRAGFCGHCLANFEKHLAGKFTTAQLDDQFGIRRFDAAAVIARLSPLQNLADPKQRPHHNTSQDDLLFHEFIVCQEQASFDSRKHLIDALRAHARQRRREVAFTTNASDLGSVNPGGHWIRALMFADIFDLFIYEQNVEPAGMPSDDVTRYPRGKWGAFHKLAHAVHHRRAPAVIHASAMGRLLQRVMIEGKTINTWMAVQSAEAYAANGAYVQYYIEPKAGTDLFFDKFWVGSAKHAAFVQSHRDFYGGDLRSGSPLAVLFLMNERGRTIPAVYPSYLGFAQGLIECNVPFDVVFAGDGRYVRDQLTLESVKQYATLIVPSPVAPTENQKQVIQDFVRAGGTIVCQEPRRLDIVRGDAALQPVDLAGCDEQFRYGKGKVAVLRGGISDTWTDDIGSNYFKTYQPELKAEIGRLAESLGVSTLNSGETKGLVGVFPIRQPDRDRLVVHLVNYDIDYTNDAIHEKTDVVLSVQRPDFLPDNVVARLYAAEDDPQLLDVSSSMGRLRFSAPRLDVWATVVVTCE